MKTSSGILAVAFILSMICGCGSDGGGPITVKGKVVNAKGQALANLTVVVTGLPSTTSDTAGDFTVANVKTPYDVTVLSSVSKGAIVYKGLTRADPTLCFMGPGLSTPSAHSATVGGTVSGGVQPPISHLTYIAFGSTETHASMAADYASPNFTYNLPLSWYGSTTTTGTLHALQLQLGVTLYPVAYTGYGEKAGAVITDGGAITGQNFELVDLSHSNIAGTITLPAGYAVSKKEMSVVFSDKAEIDLLSDTTSTTTFGYMTPSISGATMTIHVSAGNGSEATMVKKSQLAADASGVTVAIPAAPILNLPASGATGVTTATNFSWSAFASGIHVVKFEPTDSANPLFYVITKSDTISIPDLTLLGMGLPATAGYTWSVIGFGPFSDVDAAAGQNLLMPSGDTIYESSSSERTFTTL